MDGFELDPRLAADCHRLVEHDGNLLLLLDNADYPWFVIVPATTETEFFRLDADLQLRLLAQINLLSAFVESNFDIDKLNVATIGNVVAQLHVHVVGRRRDDPAWPDVVWGAPKARGYPSAEVERIRAALLGALGCGSIA